ncbi:MAG: DNA gyrase subunit A, partial [Candidatus Odinarchaeota archaeon]
NNFDDSKKEPKVLPAAIPNLLINGSSGIAVGMATNMPPHNLREVIEGVIFYIDNQDCTIKDLRKFIKGPDIFCEVIKRLNKDFDIHVFLTGPARGYVKNQLLSNGIPFTHVFLKNYFELTDCYNVLDLYIISSRTEGGPLALLECMATGVPIVSTKVGMVPELINNGINGFVSEIEDIENLYENCKKILSNYDIKEKIINNGFETIQSYSWEKVIKNYYNRMYKNLLNKLNI